MYDLREATFRTPGGHPIRMHYRDGTNDWNTLTSCLTEDEYELPSGISGRALDVGGHIGSVGIALAIDNPDLAVTIIEPVPENCELIRRNREANGLQANRAFLIEGAAGQGDVEVRYRYTGSDHMEQHAFIGNITLAEPDTPHQTRVYPGQPLDRFTPLAFLKIDAEGAEYDFLDSPAVSDVETIVGEWHNNDGHVLGDMLSLLDATHVVTFTGPQAGPGGFRAVRR